MPGLAARQAARAPGSGRTGFEFFGLEAPQADQSADTGVKQCFAEQRKTLRIGNKMGHFGADDMSSFRRQSLH